MFNFQAMIQLKVLGEGLNLWHKKSGAYWIKVRPQHTCWRIWKKVTPLARQEQSRSLEELRERAWSLPWPIVEAAALLENKVGSKFTGKKKTSTVDWMWFQAKRRVQGDFGIEFCGGEHSFLLFEVQLCNLHLVFVSCIAYWLCYWSQIAGLACWHLLASSGFKRVSLSARLKLPPPWYLQALPWSDWDTSHQSQVSINKLPKTSSYCAQATTTGVVGIWLPHCSPVANIWLSRL